MQTLFDTQKPEAAPVAYAHVALEQGIDLAPGGLTYAVPASLAGVDVGDRVIVPLGRGDKPVTGYVLELSRQCDLPPGKLARLKAIVARDPQGVSLTADMIALARWMSGYYCCPLGMVFVTMLPAAVKHGTGTVWHTMVSLTDAAAPSRLTDKKKARGGEATDGPVKLTKLQRAIVDAAAKLAADGQAWTQIKDLADAAGARTVSPVKQLITKGLLVTEQTAHVEPRAQLRLDDDDERALARPQVLTPDQDRAVQHIAEMIGNGFSVNLLHGVNSSGKTEVYLRTIEHLLSGPDNTRGAIVLVPEIALTPQTVGRFHARFDDVAVMHSGLTPARRHEQWQRIRRGEVRIVVGARSAVFAPLPNPGVIVVDEEHSEAFKQDQLPRYHARDVAVKRAQLLNIPIVLGSATPSLESYYNATVKKSYHLLHLPQRLPGQRLPKVEIVDMSAERRKRYEMTGKSGVHLLSLRLEAALRSTLRDKGQAMLLLNRRGYGNYISCPDHGCGWIMRCTHCDVGMVYHKSRATPDGGFVYCHHCETRQQLPKVCPQCGKKVTVFGLGTQRVEEEIARKFPEARLLRMDSDTMRSGRDYYTALGAFRQGTIDVLLGTQMIAKGLDFPNVRLVGVISADTALHLPDFRAAERTFALIAQVAGRTGRGSDPGLVIVQSFCPDDPAIVLASQHDYETFAQREIALRQGVGLPPVTRMARIVVRDRDTLACYEQARKLADALAASNTQLGLDVRIRGPAPCPISRLNEFYRQQIELIAPDAAALQKLMTALRNARLLKSDAHTAVDVDPVALL